MICIICKSSMVHYATDLFEDLGMEEDGMVEMHICNKCGCTIEIYIPEKSLKYRGDNNE